MTDNNHDAPKSAANITDADISRGITKGEAQDATVGIPQDQINLRSLQQEIDALEAKRDAQTANGGGYDRVLDTRLAARRKTLEYQTALYKENGGERRDHSIMSEIPEAENRQLQSIRDTNMLTAVNREIDTQRRNGKQISDFEAMQIVEKRIATEGEAAVLPQYARVKARIIEHHTPVVRDPMPEPDVPPTATEADNNGLPSIEAVEATIAKAVAAGGLDDPAMAEQIEDLQGMITYLRSQAA